MPRRKTRSAPGKPTSGSVAAALVKRLTVIDALLAGDLPRPVCQSEGRFKRLYVEPTRATAATKRIQIVEQEETKGTERSLFLCCLCSLLFKMRAGKQGIAE